MSLTLSRLWLWFWHLLPANPILVRVIHGASQRSRHLWLRVGYLTALLVVVLFSLIVSMSGKSSSLAELAKGASQTFKFASITQLALICFLAPMFTAAAITQERDARTFSILLSTPLTSAQIVFGSFLSRLYFVLVLLVAGLPIFVMTMAYGGITKWQIFESFALSASTAVLTGALAILVAMIRVGTRGTIFSFYLVIGMYLLTVYLLGQWDQTWVAESPENIAGKRMSWLTPLHPFLALDVAINRIHAPPSGRLTGYAAISRYALANPSAAYAIWTTCLAFTLTVLSILFVRRDAKTGETTRLGALWGRLRRRTPGERTRPPRNVWANPIAWREAKTRAGSSNVLRWMLILGGMTGSAVLFIYHSTGALAADEVRLWLGGWIIIQFALALLIATNAAATSMTKEKESKTMDLLLTTPVSSKYVLWGKLRGLVSYAVPLLAGPVIVLLGFAIYAVVRGEAVPAVRLEVALELAALTLIYTACACIIALRVSLFSKTNVTAVMYSVGLMILLCGITTLLGFAVVGEVGGELGAFLARFSPFTSIWYLVAPHELFGNAKDFARSITATRMAGSVGSFAATALYTFAVWTAYRGLVRNFDMIVRKQSGT